MKCHFLPPSFYLRPTDLDFCLENTDFSEEEILQWFRKFRSTFDLSLETVSQGRMPKWKADKGPTEGPGKDPLSARYLLFSLFRGCTTSLLQGMPKTLSITFCGSLTQTATISSVSKSSCWRWTLPTAPPVSSNSRCLTPLCRPGEAQLGVQAL